MAEIKAFKGLRYSKRAGSISELCCPPYDVISNDQRLEYISKNKHNIIHLELPKEGDNPYLTAADTLKMWKQSGILVTENKPAIYVYEQEFVVNGECRSVKGIIARVRLEDFESGIILPHEFTLSGAKADRLNLMKSTNCNFSQVYALYMDVRHKILRHTEELSYSAPEIELIDSDSVTHRLWTVTDKNAIAQLTSAFADKKLYIADGHHRYETALAYRDFCKHNGRLTPAQEYQMMFLVDMEHIGLAVLPTHRLVCNIKDFDKNVVVKKCREYFDVAKMSGADSIIPQLSKQYKNDKKSIAFYCGNGEWYLLTLRNPEIMQTILPQLSCSSQQLDVTILHTLILEKVLGIDRNSITNQSSLAYTRYTDEAILRVDSGEFQCSFLLNPTRVSEIRDVAAAGEKMPQKSTYFYPKLITGLVMNDLSIE